MLRRARIAVAYTASGLTIGAALLTPFVLIDVFTRGVAALGVRVDPVYSGGDVAYRLAREGYVVVVHRPVVPQGPLTRTSPFVQIEWQQASALPARISDEIDIDGDGHADLAVAFDVPRDTAAPLSAEVRALTAAIAAERAVVRRDSFESLITRVGDRIVLRVPIK